MNFNDVNNDCLKEDLISLNVVGSVETHNVAACNVVVGNSVRVLKKLGSD